MPLIAASQAVADQEVILGIRPLDIRIDPEGSLTGLVDFVEKTGAETHIHMTFAHRKIRAVSPTRLGVKRGETLAFDIDPVKMHLFDRKTEQRIKQA